jgi:hypothetical protein
MIADYYCSGFDRRCIYGEKVLVNPMEAIFIPVRGNLKAIIDSEEKINLFNNADGLSDSLARERNPPALFWSEYLSSKKDDKYVFETKYIKNSDEILPISSLDNIPSNLRKEFLCKVTPEVSKLANKIVRNEKETKTILKRFYDFILENQRPLNPTTGKSVETMLEEYEKNGHFTGNCKEARDFYMALCDSVGYPTKRVSGKNLVYGGHVWPDVFVPVKDGYGLFPVDAALWHFGCHNAEDQIFFEHAPKISWNFSNIIRKPQTNYKLTIESVK